MIKRRFYKQEHGDKDAPSDSSSSSDSDLDAEASVDTEEEEDDDNNGVMESKKRDRPSSSSSGYESEDSSANEVNLDSSGLSYLDSPTNDDDSGGENHKRAINGSRLSAKKRFDTVTAESKEAADDAKENEAFNCVLKSKSVFKCKLCPRIVCLTEETLKAHLKSKRHARSEKLLKEGRLKMILNSDGEIEELEEDGVTHQERHAATIALAKSKDTKNDLKKNKGRQRQRKRLKKKTSDDLAPKDTKKSVKRPSKKRRKSDA